MPNTREKLIELLKEADRYEFEEQKKSGTYSVEAGWKLIADHLIANGVMIPVHCEECQHWDPAHCSDDQGWCPKIAGYRPGDWYCAAGERKVEKQPAEDRL